MVKLKHPESAKVSLVAILCQGLKAIAAMAVMLVLEAPALSAEGNRTYDMEKVAPYEYRGDVRDLPRFPLVASTRSKPYVHPVLRPPRTEKFLLQHLAPEYPSLNVPLVPLAPMPSPTQNFGGANFNDSCTGGQCGGGWPPDPNGDVGPSHYIQAVNDAFIIYDKTGTKLASFTEDSLWSGAGTNPCNGNSEGDPIVLYDQLADRWILTNFAFPVDKNFNPISPFYECIAVSKTGDPVSGGWWLYPLRMDPGGTGKPPSGTMNDYPKFGIWPDCLYMAANGFSATGFLGTQYASFSRSDLESGATLTWSLGFINNTTDPFTMIPSNLLGSSSGSLPPSGTPNYFVSESRTAFDFEVRKFTAGPNCGGGGTLSAPTSVSQASYNLPSTTFDVVPQPNATNKLDMMDDRLMQKVQYRNIGGAESLWVVHNVVSPSTSLVAPQWAQIDVTGGTIATTPVQQQIYAPDSTLYRWMGSLAVDTNGNMALGYSTSNGAANNYPSIAYSGRLAGDAAGTLPQTETQLVAGGGSQTLKIGSIFVDRWGDYTAMSMDPSDDCTFWYTNEYYSSQAAGNLGNWQTRIGSFKFPTCTPTAASAPVVSTAPITNITYKSASGGGTVIATGGAAVNGRGVCWNTTGNPTTTDSCTQNGTGTGTFTSSLTGLTSNSIYYVRAYAVNGAVNGTGYGNQVSIVRPNPPSGVVVK